MRRTFLRIPGSPQAIATVETPAHYTPTLLLQFGSFVRGGEWECQSLLCLVSHTKHDANIQTFWEQNMSFA